MEPVISGSALLLGTQSSFLILEHVAYCCNRYGTPTHRATDMLIERTVVQKGQTLVCQVQDVIRVLHTLNGIEVQQKV